MYERYSDKSLFIALSELCINILWMTMAARARGSSGGTLSARSLTDLYLAAAAARLAVDIVPLT